MASSKRTTSPWYANRFDLAYTDPTNRYDKAHAVFKKASTEGFVSASGALNFAQGSELANLAAGAQGFFNAEKKSGTDQNKVRQERERALLDYFDGNGEYFVQRQYDKKGLAVGTALMWKSARKEDPFHGKPVALAVSYDPRAKVSDFAAASGWGFAEGLKKNLFTERFHKLHFAVFNENVKGYPTQDEMEALGKMETFRDAAEVVRRGDPRKQEGGGQ